MMITVGNKLHQYDDTGHSRKVNGKQYGGLQVNIRKFIYRITASLLAPDKVKMKDKQDIYLFIKQPELLRTLSSVDRCVIR